MNKAVRSCLVSSFLVSLSGAGLAEDSSASQPREAPQIMVRVFNYAEVPGGTLEAAQREAARILGEAGIALVWLRCALSEEELAQNPSCETVRGPRALNLRLLPRPMAVKMGYGAHDFGHAVLPDEGELASDASVFYHLIDNLAETRTATRPALLGHILAHEIGHLLLGRGSHSRKGIMRVPWNKPQLERASWGRLLFSLEEATRMRANVQERLQLALGGRLAGHHDRRGSISSTPRFGPTIETVAPCFSAPATVRAQSGRLGQQGPLMTVRLYDYGQVPPGVLERAIPHAERVLRRAGVEVAWTGCKTPAASLLRTAACELPAHPDHILLRFVSPSMDRVWDDAAAPPLGYALPDAKSGFGSVASVFYHRTEDLVRRVRSRSEGRVFSVPLVLGHVIAHEIGHLLLGAKGHSGTGIMQFPLGREQLQAMRTGDLLFTKEQAKRIRQNVRRRMKTAERIETAKVE